MKSLMAFGILFFALSFCGITDKIKEQVSETSNNSTTRENTGTTEKNSDGDDVVEKPELTDEQQKILDNGKEIKWDDQGINFTVPDGWSKMSVQKQMLNYGSPKTGFLISSVSIMQDDFPVEMSLKATHTQALQQLKNGRYENVRWLELGGIKGVEWVEAPSENKGNPRRHQWIGFRNYQGQNQQLNIILSTKSGEFDDKKDTFAAILYSTKTNN